MAAFDPHSRYSEPKTEEWMDERYERVRALKTFPYPILQQRMFRAPEETATAPVGKAHPTRARLAQDIPHGIDIINQNLADIGHSLRVSGIGEKDPATLSMAEDETYSRRQSLAAVAEDRFILDVEHDAQAHFVARMLLTAQLKMPVRENCRRLLKLEHVTTSTVEAFLTSHPEIAPNKVRQHIEEMFQGVSGVFYEYTNLLEFKLTSDVVNEIFIGPDTAAASLRPVLAPVNVQELIEKIGSGIQKLPIDRQLALQLQASVVGALHSEVGSAGQFPALSPEQMIAELKKSQLIAWHLIEEELNAIEKAQKK